MGRFHSSEPLCIEARKGKGTIFVENPDYQNEEPLRTLAPISILVTREEGIYPLAQQIQMNPEKEDLTRLYPPPKSEVWRGLRVNVSGDIQCIRFVENYCNQYVRKRV